MDAIERDVRAALAEPDSIDFRVKLYTKIYDFFNNKSRYDYGKDYWDLVNSMYSLYQSLLREFPLRRTELLAMFAHCDKLKKRYNNGN